ncbi:MAG: NnrS family protein [Gammaproteobacteria bacterium]|nr:NnrS family protein [Gammaproteobacteria bacterium]
MMPLLRYGFRPFFLGAGLVAMLLIPWWAASYAFGIPLGTGWPPTLWHGHEMLFGFIVAAIAGFLLTAVPSWTGARGFAGRPLALLAGLWLLGRVAVATSRLWPPPVVTALDLAFLPALAALVLPPLVRARNRNTPLLAVLAALWAADAAFYWGLYHRNDGASLHALVLGIDIVLLLVTVIGGRIVPAFTASALKQHAGPGSLRLWPGASELAIGSMIAVVLSDLLVPDGRIAGVIAALAAAAQAARLAQWRTLKTLRQPIVWVLHIAYAWLPIGLALKAAALLTGAATAAFWLHALTIGAAATMILAVMTRASLGHTGRPLVVDPVIGLAYLLLTAAALVRVFGLAVLGIDYPEVILTAAFLWTAAFVLFTWIYAPMLLAPRVDGKPG